MNPEYAVRRFVIIATIAAALGYRGAAAAGPCRAIEREGEGRVFNAFDDLAPEKGYRAVTGAPR